MILSFTYLIIYSFDDLINNITNGKIYNSIIVLNNLIKYSDIEKFKETMINRHYLNEHQYVTIHNIILLND